MAFDMGSAAEGGAAGAQTGNPYVAAGMAIIGGFSGGRAKKKKKKAAKAQAEAMRQYGLKMGELGKETQLRMDPFSPYRAKYASQLDRIQSGSEEWKQDPGYLFRLQEANREVGRAGAAKGYGNSGNVLAALQQRNQDVASAEYSNVFARLADLSGETGHGAAAGQVYGDMTATGLGAIYGGQKEYNAFKGGMAQSSHNNIMSAMNQGAGAYSKISDMFGGNKTYAGIGSGGNEVASRNSLGGVTNDGRRYTYL